MIATYQEIVGACAKVLSNLNCYPTLHLVTPWERA